MESLRQRSTSISPKLWQAIADAQTAAHAAHNLAYEEHASAWLCMALGRAQSILIHWQVKLAGRQR